MRNPIHGSIALKKLQQEAMDNAALVHTGNACSAAAYRFDVGGLLGAGANCLAYEGTLRDESGLEQTGLLKEYLPAGVALRSTDGISVNAAPGMEQSFRCGMERFLERHTRINRFAADFPESVNALTQLHSAYMGGGTLYLFFPLSRGQDYSAHEETDPEQLVRHMITLVQSAHMLHSCSLLHLDIKPSNIIYLRESDSLRLIDFDSVVSLPITQEQVRFMTYSDGFSSPEQISGNLRAVGVPSDLYAIGAVFYHKLYGGKVSDAYPSMPRIPYRSGSPMFSRMRADTYRLLRRILLKSLAILPAMRYRSAADMIADLKSLLSLICRDRSAHSPLLTHCMAAYALSCAGLGADSAYLSDVFTSTHYTLAEVEGCLREMESSLLYPQRWEELFYICQALITTPSSPWQQQGETDSERSTAARCRTRLLALLRRACNGLGAGAPPEALVPEGESIAGADARLEEAERLKDSFCFEAALSVVDGQEEAYAALLALDDPALREAANNAMMCLLGKQGELLFYLRRFREGMERTERACRHAQLLPVARVQVLRCLTNLLRGAVFCADEREMHSILERWQAALSHLTGTPAQALDTPEGCAALLASLLRLQDGHADYQKGHLVHALLFYLRHRCSGTFSQPALEVFDRWYAANGDALARHPGELILKTASMLAIHCGRTDAAGVYLRALREFPPARTIFVERILCLCSEAEILRALGEDADATCKAAAAAVQAHIRTLSAAQAKTVRAQFAPCLARRGHPEECLTYMYR